MRIVVKIGTRVLIGKNGLDARKVDLLMNDVSGVIKKGHEVIMVSSGAIGTGLPFVHFSSPARKKIAAAVGQPLLMHDYIHAALKRRITVGQVLILSEDFRSREHFGNFLKNIEAMLSHKVLPIINENDFMKAGDLTVGDNDMFGAVVAAGIKADRYVILTDQDGLFTSNPDRHDGASLVKIVKKIDKKIEKLCGTETSDLGRGGMLSKVRAAKFATDKGIETFIGRGSRKGVLLKALNGNFPGTRFAAKGKTKK